MKQFVKNNFFLALLMLLVVASFLRFYHFSERWGIGSDDMRDISIAKEALVRHEIPLIGSFSSAGPFVFGPLYYWFLMASYQLLPFTITAPWIFAVLISIATVFVLYKIGERIYGVELGLIMGLFACFSPQLIYRSTAMSQHSFIPLSSSLLVLSFILLWQKKEKKYAFFMGFSLSVALSLHYQAVNLLLFFPAVFFVQPLIFRKRFVAFLFMFAGFLIPSLPLLIWDSHQAFANTRNLLDYLLLGQYRLYVPNSWKLFIFTYLPSYWSFVIGGYSLIALVLIFLTFGTSLYTIFKKTMNHVQIVLLCIFIILLFLNKFYHGERSEGYLMYFIPFIFLFSAYSIQYLFFRTKKTFFFGVLAVAFLSLGSFMAGKTYVFETNNRGKEFEQSVTKLINSYPNTSFSVYDYAWRDSQITYGFQAFLKNQNKLDKNGMPIGIGCYESVCLKDLRIIGKIQGFEIADLTSDPLFKTGKSKWGNVNQETIYDDLMRWQKKDKLVSTFNPVKFLLRQ